jgi:hypothetical protein
MKDMVYGARMFIIELKGKVVMNFRSKETLRNDHYYLGSHPTIDTALIPLCHTFFFPRKPSANLYACQHQVSCI